MALPPRASTRSAASAGRRSETATKPPGQPEAAGTVPTHAAGEAGDRAEHLRFRVIPLEGGADLPTDPARERLVHVVAGQILAGIDLVSAPQTLALRAGEVLPITAEGAADVLVVSA